MNKRFKIADWTVDPNQCLLVRSPKNLKLEPKAMALLVVLAEANGELVSRQQIFDLIWPDQHVTDYALNTLISNLRKTLGTANNGENLIETRPKLGYRLATEIEWLNSSPSNINIINSDSRIKYFIATFLMLLAILSIYGFSLFFEDKESQPVIENKNKINYLIKVNLNYTFSEKNEKGENLCQNYSYDALSSAIYAKNKWTIISQYFSYQLKHTGSSLVDINENHRLEYKHVLGTEIDEMKIKVNSTGELTGHAKMLVQDSKGKKLCEGMSIFIGEKI